MLTKLARALPLLLALALLCTSCALSASSGLRDGTAVKMADDPTIEQPGYDRGADPALPSSVKPLTSMAMSDGIVVAEIEEVIDGNLYGNEFESLAKIKILEVICGDFVAGESLNYIILGSSVQVRYGTPVSSYEIGNQYLLFIGYTGVKYGVLYMYDENDYNDLTYGPQYYEIDFRVIEVNGQRLVVKKRFKYVQPWTVDAPDVDAILTEYEESLSASVVTNAEDYMTENRVKFQDKIDVITVSWDDFMEFIEEQVLPKWTVYQEIKQTGGSSDE